MDSYLSVSGNWKIDIPGQSKQTEKRQEFPCNHYIEVV